MKFKCHVAFLRNKHGISIRSLAEKVKVSHVTISRLENNKQLPSIELAFRISKYFNCPIEDIWEEL